MLMTSASEVYIEGTIGDPVVWVRHWLADRNDELLAEVRSRTALLPELRLRPADRQAVQADLIAICTEGVLRYLALTDRVLYTPAAGATETRLLVHALRTEHQIISRHIHDLSAANAADRMSEAAHAVATVLAACLEVQRAVLLPALAVLPGVDLASLAQDLDTLLDGGELDKPSVLDVREMPHGQRLPSVFGLYARLAPGESFVLVNSHDPRRLRHEFDTAYPGRVSWEYLETGPAQWRVRIGPLPESG
jgi:uncharacterized protein (DUF2249 family)